MSGNGCIGCGSFFRVVAFWWSYVAVRSCCCLRLNSYICSLWFWYWARSFHSTLKPQRRRPNSFCYHALLWQWLSCSRCLDFAGSSRLSFFRSIHLSMFGLFGSFPIWTETLSCRIATVGAPSLNRDCHHSEKLQDSTVEQAENLGSPSSSLEYPSALESPNFRNPSTASPHPATRFSKSELFLEIAPSRNWLDAVLKEKLPIHC